MEMMRLATAGSVDDGKSTLIGRLLYDSKAIFEDQLESVERTPRSLDVVYDFGDRGRWEFIIEAERVSIERI